MLRMSRFRLYGQEVLLISISMFSQNKQSLTTFSGWIIIFERIFIFTIDILISSALSES